MPAEIAQQPHRSLDRGAVSEAARGPPSVIDLRVCSQDAHFVPVSDLLYNHPVDDRCGVNDSEQADDFKGL